MVVTESSHGHHRVITPPYSKMLFILHLNRSQTIQHILIFPDCDDCDDCDDLIINL